MFSLLMWLPLDVACSRCCRKGDRLLLAGIVLLVSCFGQLTEPRALSAETVTPPNILFILIDDMSWADLACYGNRFHETPQIDRLAAEGLRFTDFYAAGAVCSPTRASIQSGQNQARLGITDFIPGHQRPFAPLLVPEVVDHLPLKIVTPAEALRHAGYVSGYFGKWHLGGPAYEPSQQGYDVSVVTNGGHTAPRFRTNPQMEIPDGTYLADFLTDQTIDFIRQQRDRPFFAFLSHFAVHIPLDAEETLVEKYRQKPKPETGVNNPVYAAMVEHVDHSVGRLLETLRELELDERTLVILTSDNGGLYQTAGGGGPIVCSNAPLRDEKGSLYEGGIRVPLIVRWPGRIPAGTVSSEPCSTIDFWPTWLEVAGFNSDELPFDHQELDGMSLLPVFEEPRTMLPREALYFHYPHYHHSRPAGAIRHGRWKLIEFFETGDLELYRLDADLSEEQNLLLGDERELYVDLAQLLQQKLVDWRTAIGAELPTPNPDHDPDRELEIRRRTPPRRNPR